MTAQTHVAQSRFSNLSRAINGGRCPCLSDIACLVDGVRVTGADVHLDDRRGGDIEMAVERPIATAYRIVQEGP